jgi:glyoxylase-like metal-dependent hydrolase (beta-lactamase superfamily II)
MTTFVCKACGTQYPPGDEPPGACSICEDARQYIPHDEGQVWLTWDEVRGTRSADIRDDHGILGIGSDPGFAIGQRALLVKSAVGNVLWDCISHLDDEIVERVSAEGGLAAIAISHPHYYSSLVEWAQRFDCPVYLHADDAEWLMRPDDHVVLWQGETHELGDGLTLVRCGGHFAGGQVLHLANRRALLSGDIVQVIPDRRWVSFMYSYPNLVPLGEAAVRRIVEALEPFPFDSIHGAWWGRVVEDDGSEIVRRSADRYIRAIRGDAV